MKSPDISYRSVAEIKKFQELKLVELVAYLQQNSSFYKRLFLDSGFSAASIQTFEDLVLLPVTTKEDLQQHNYDFLCADLAKVIDYSSTSGTLGSPVSIMLTDNDLNRLAYNEYCSFVCTGANEKDIFQLMLTLDRQFMAGMAYYTGLRKLGAGIIRLGPGVPSLQWETILRIQPTAIVAVPSFILKLIEYAQIHSIDINSTSVKKAICIGENIRNPDFELNILGKKITDSWNIELYSTYASTEMQTAFTECEQGKGGHLNPELLIVEIVNENNQPVKSGEAGEVTITTLGVEGMPLLRYKTGDVCFFVDEPCRCGRNTLRLSPLIGRKNK